jgi:hypothetical protein
MGFPLIFRSIPTKYNANSCLTLEYFCKNFEILNKNYI